jgi:PAS domain S-box-containing protein
MSNTSWNHAPPEAALTLVEAEAALRDSEERFRAFVTAGTDVVYRLNADWSELHQLVGRNFIADVARSTDGWLDEYIYPEDQTCMLATIAEAIRTRGVFEMEHRVRRLNGSVGWTHSRAVPLLDAQGSIREWIGNAVDITERRHKEQALAESQARYSGLLDSINDGYCAIELIFDANDTAVDFTYVEVNPAFEKLTGMHDVLGRRVRELLPDVEQDWLDTYGKVALTGEAVRRIDEVKPLNRWFEVCCYRLGGPESRKIAVLFNNITEQKKAEHALRESEALYRGLFNSIDEGFAIIEMIFDADHRAVDYLILEVNPGFEQQCGLLNATGKRILELVPDHEPYWLEMYGKVALTGEPVRVQAESKALQSWFETRAFRIGGEGSLKVAVIFNNITERRNVERKLQEQAQELSDQDRRKDEFLAMLSHELRNPLAPLTNALHMLRLQPHEDPVQRQARGIIERQVGQLKHLVGELLEISRITTGRVQLHLERIDLSGVLDRAIETAQPLIDERRHVLEVSAPPHPLWLQADASRLEQVVVNLLTNAAKYTDPGGRIWLSVAQEGHEAVLRVRDTGIGIAAAQLPHIFGLFTQAEVSLDRSQGGLGIGLCLVKRLVELHGGNVAVTSVLGQGSEFVVRLPVTSLDPPPPQAEVARPAGKCCRVLVVDDNVDAAQSMGVLLTMQGHEVRVVHDGAAALEAVQSFSAGVVLLDIGLPGLTGLEVARRIRQLPALQSLVLVAITGYGEESDRERSRDAGFDHHLVKPTDLDALLKILETVPAMTA